MAAQSTRPSQFKPLIAASLFTLALSLAGCSGQTANDTVTGQVTETKERDPQDSLDFVALAERHASAIFSQSPEWATQMGVSEDIAGVGFNKRLSDFSAEGREKTVALNQSLIAELLAVDRQALEGTAAITYDVMLNAYRLAERQNNFGTGPASILTAAQPFVVDQLFGPQIFFPRLFSAQIPLNSPEQVEAYLSRLSELGQTLRDITDIMNQDAAVGVLPHDAALESVAATARGFAELEETENPILIYFEDRLGAVNGLTPGQKAAHLETAKTIMQSDILPSFASLAEATEALRATNPPGDGIWKVPNGDNYYRVALDNYGATSLSPDEVHQLGLDDVERIHSEMDAILKSVGYIDGPVGERMSALSKDPDYLWDNTDEGKEEALSIIRTYVEEMKEVVPDWFGNVPDLPLEVRRIPTLEENSSGGAYYTPPALDGSQPGIFWINLKDTANWPKYSVKSLVYHEGIPGHHFQAAYLQEIDDMPLIRNMMWFADYGEGWALYTEELAKEMGLYDGDPLGDLGRLRMELYRAARLVVDTGLHDKRWTREQAIDWMSEATGETRESITREIDRYSVWPGQATSYKIGMIKFQRVRRKAEETLGSDFDIRSFHDEILKGGAMPMPVLERRMDDWIKSQKTSLK